MSDSLIKLTINEFALADLERKEEGGGGVETAPLVGNYKKGHFLDQKPPHPPFLLNPNSGEICHRTSEAATPIRKKSRSANGLFIDRET